MFFNISDWNSVSGSGRPPLFLWTSPNFCEGELNDDLPFTQTNYASLNNIPSFQDLNNIYEEEEELEIKNINIRN